MTLLSVLPYTVRGNSPTALRARRGIYWQVQRPYSRLAAPRRLGQVKDPRLPRF